MTKERHLKIWRQKGEENNWQKKNRYIITSIDFNWIVTAEQEIRSRFWKTNERL